MKLSANYNPPKEKVDERIVEDGNPTVKLSIFKVDGTDEFFIFGARVFTPKPHTEPGYRSIITELYTKENEALEEAARIKRVHF